MLDTDAEADQLGLDTCRELLLVGQLLMRGGSRVDRERLGVADVGKIREELHVVDKGRARGDV